jgi:hypothetical protein
VASISYNGSPATADYAPEKKSAKLENEIESADTAEQRSDVAPTYQVKSSYIQGIGTKKVLWKKSYENVYCKLLKEKNWRSQELQFLSRMGDEVVSSKISTLVSHGDIVPKTASKLEKLTQTQVCSL